MLVENSHRIFEKIILVVGTRPNYVKIFPLCVELKRQGIPYEIFHSGQHYDPELSKVFEKDFKLDCIHFADIKMSGNSIKDMQSIMKSFHAYLKKQNNVAGVIVVGDVNTSYACSLVAKRFDGLPLIHLEAGLRSFDQTMPEEVNRITIDHLSDYLLCPSDDSVANLKDEGVNRNVYMVGNIMIDSLISCLASINKKIKDQRLKNPYCVVTFHRQENVDKKEILFSILHDLNKISEQYDVYFPMHPRTKNAIDRFGLHGELGNIKILPPLGYIDFLSLVVDSTFVMTDSGGITEETSYLGIPCYTVRNNTERPITITMGTNQLINYSNIIKEVLNKKQERRKTKIPYWDGHTAVRIVDLLINKIQLI